ncbi:MAG: glycosyltransferase [Methylobacillus sp.]|jgi:glycosyltransferase involved in cell wall biosynthesis|nr:glycosyltransferase [Methylobacillus sp.]
MKLQASPIRLSICIATYNRGDFIVETLDSIVPQLTPNVELIVVDGASPDNTQQVMIDYAACHPQIRYYRESENSGVDKDYDKAVGYAQGEYCWLMTDDDLLHPHAIQRVLEVLMTSPDLVVVNAEVRNRNLSNVLRSRHCLLEYDKYYSAEEWSMFFREVGDYLSFIGGVVMRRSVWLARDRASYYGTLFIHFGVIFQNPMPGGAQMISEPLIIIRYGNAMWTPRGFEIWMFKWPRLIWSFTNITAEDKQTICPVEPWRDSLRIVYQRAKGAYTISEFRAFLAEQLYGRSRLVAYLVAVLPGWLANIACVAGLLWRQVMPAKWYTMQQSRAESMVWYELLRSRYATWLSRGLVKVFRPKEYAMWAHSLVPRSKTFLHQENAE